MRALVVAQSKTPPPMEMLPTIGKDFRAWRDQYRDKLEAFSFFTTSNGGCAIANVADETELYQMLLDWPLSIFSDIEVHPLVDGDEALKRWIERVESMSMSAG